MGVVPANKAGQGSAVNDATTEVVGTLGVAVIGSVFASVYSGSLAYKPGWSKVPAELLTKAEDGIGLAFGVVKGIGKSVGSVQSETLTRGAIDSVINGLHAGCTVAAVVTLIGAVLAAVFLPAQPNAHSTAESSSAARRTISLRLRKPFRRRECTTLQEPLPR